MTNTIETLMKELGVGICEDFKVKPNCAGQGMCTGIYHFDELGVLRRADGTPKDAVLGFLARGRFDIEKVKRFKLKQWEKDLLGMSYAETKFKYIDVLDHMKHMGYFKGVIDISMTIGEILDNCEVEND